MSDHPTHTQELDEEELELAAIYEYNDAHEDFVGDGVDDDDGDSEYEYHGEEESDDNDLFHDAENGEEVEIEIIVENDDDEDDEDDVAQVPAVASPNIGQLMNIIGGGRTGGRLTHRQLLLLLRGQDLGRVLFNDFDDDDEDGVYYRRRRTRPDPDRFPKIPSDKGTELMESGLFGSADRVVSPLTSPKKQLARRILDRELGLGDPSSRKRNQDLMAQSLIPTTDPDMIIRYEQPVYSGQFSDDGNFFFSVVKDFRVRMYDTSNPYNWRHYKTVMHPFGRWTLTDASLSPDNKWLAYTSIQPTVCLAPTDPNDTGDPYTLDLSESGMTGRGRGGWRNAHSSFGIFSIRFSGDGRELVAGNNDNSIIVFDIESRRVLHNIAGHDDDVNAVCFADKNSPHILYSGSDDSTVKVWDTRSLGDQREAGAFVGHCQGLTYIDSKGDGRYVLSNSKDQTMKLWDLRMAMSTEEFGRKNPTQHTRHHDFDYRMGEFDEDDWFKHPDDNSLVTFRGHRVQRTLIRCHFSPPGSTNSRYVYSGSYDGKVYVWNMDATIAAKIDVREANSTMLPPRYRRHGGHSRWTTCVREAHWHPNAPVLVASAWNGAEMDFGTCSVHSYNESAEDEAEPKMGRRVDDKLAPLGPWRENHHAHLADLWNQEG